MHRILCRFLYYKVKLCKSRGVYSMQILLVVYAWEECVWKGVVSDGYLHVLKLEIDYLSPSYRVV